MDEEAEEIARIRKHLQLVNHDPDFDRYPKISRLIDVFHLERDAGGSPAHNLHHRLSSSLSTRAVNNRPASQGALLGGSSTSTSRVAGGESHRHSPHLHPGAPPTNNQSEFASALERFNAGFLLSRLFVDESGAHLPLPIVSDETNLAENASLVSKHLAEEKEGAASGPASGTTAAAAARKETKDDDEELQAAVSVTDNSSARLASSSKESALSEGSKEDEELAENNGNDETVKKHKSHRRHSTIIAADEEKINTENDNASGETVVKKKSSASARAKAGFRNNRKTVTFCAGGSDGEEEPDLDKEDEGVLDSDAGEEQKQMSTEEVDSLTSTGGGGATTTARAPTPFAREADGEEALNVVVPPPGTNFTALQKLSEPLAQIIQNGVANIHAHLPTSHTLDRPAKHIHNLLGGGATATGGGKIWPFNILLHFKVL